MLRGVMLLCRYISPSKRSARVVERSALSTYTASAHELGSWCFICAHSASVWYGQPIQALRGSMRPGNLSLNQSKQSERDSLCSMSGQRLSIHFCRLGFILITSSTLMPIQSSTNMPMGTRSPKPKPIKSRNSSSIGESLYSRVHCRLTIPVLPLNERTNAGMEVNGWPVELVPAKMSSRMLCLPTRRIGNGSCLASQSICR